MSIDLLGQRQIKRHQHCRPDNSMEAHYLLAYELYIRRPIAGKITISVRIAHRCYIVGQSVDPYIDDMLGIKRHFDTPIKSSTRYTEVLKSWPQEIIEHFICSRS